MRLWDQGRDQETQLPQARPSSPAATPLTRTAVQAYPAPPPQGPPPDLPATLL
eukprot:CAMPEP_0175847776 /NCGR_PEP_ID=MMETSP0107_2-20121207/23544_1 /TAXON_ID=195067 ORGANISM="Goniomonas pacifica, Strain CCMP1869" /NCGR_SAMPLE_ID=MMETSP0107_2 /ASSEMBLY_ACC=CAM_ASM_000203 /LENGTH=52 /DNA_ID=CAMNT_0017162635 /DNA_START=112 /DNA_END=266 /DNA_ORIENTATION=-